MRFTIASVFIAVTATVTVGQIKQDVIVVSEQIGGAGGGVKGGGSIGGKGGVTPGYTTTGPIAQPETDDQVLRAAGLTPDAPTLLDFLRQRSTITVDGAKLLALARQLGDADAKIRSKAATQLLTAGPAAVPALRHVLNDLDSPVAAEQAQRCLEWLEGKRRNELPIAAVRLLAERKPAGTTEALLAYLPFADDRSVVDAVKAALDTLVKGAKPEPALIEALKDKVPLRRAIAVEVLCGSGRPEVLPLVRKLLADAKPQVRLRAALAVAERWDEEGIGVLIELLADLPAAERPLAEQALKQLAGEWSPNPDIKGDDEVSRKIRRDAWAAWWQNTDGAALLAAFRQRTLTKDGLSKVLLLIEQLGDKSFAARERAVSELAALGNMVVPLLREATKSSDLERAERAAVCLKLIAKNADKDKLPTAAARLLAVRKPAGAAEAMLAFVPFTEDESMKDEIGRSLKALTVAAGKPDPVLVNSLTDNVPLRRVFAAETLAGTGPGEHLPALRKLLVDPVPWVRLRVAVALTYARDKEAVPVLIELVAELPAHEGWQVEELLHRLADGDVPKVSPGDDAAARKKRRDEWYAWWERYAAKVDLAKLETVAVSTGLIVVAEPTTGNRTNGRVVEVDRSGKVRWEINNLHFPVDVHMLPGNRVLVAEYDAQRVTERDLKGNILWQKNLGSPVNAQRLSNGNTFVATTQSLVEFTAAGAEVFNLPIPNRVHAAYKMANGQIICLTDNNLCLRLDAAGKEIKRFNYVRRDGWTSGIDVTPKGHILIEHGNDMIAEYDPDGKKIWEAPARVNTAATRLVNGNTLVSSANGSVVELDRLGRVVWEYKTPAGHLAFRARPR